MVIVVVDVISMSGEVQVIVEYFCFKKWISCETNTKIAHEIAYAY